ncbi:Tetratricopeptide repeat-containing protein [Marivirga sericea]|uniref:Tetratricopeptide repeat-containing protein n=1 Tax=Marivirga sericea TaxID=1028 RepID=A0A1X7K2F7_9BACT|nr:hypothetical protein [Marivirga sericea]SMG34859.1 Tetratricopeptide repeat-containing protein [Marivirga sericea]
MKSITFILIGLFISYHLSAIDPVGKIAKANAAKERAAEALKNGNYEKVVEHYTYLLDSLSYESPEAELNRAHAYFQLKDTVNAFDAYRKVSDAPNSQLKSKAMLQMGNLSEMQKEYESALSFFKEALKADPSNQKARYNYELLKKKMQEQEKQDQNKDQENQDQDQQDQQDKDQESKDQQNKENKDSENQKKDKNQEESQEDKTAEEQQQQEDAEQQDGEQNEQEKGKEQEQKEQQQKEGEEKKEGEEQQMNPSTKQKLEEMNISEEKAQMILEALRNKESQYFQQLRKKATKRQDSGKPDW